jgi:hypothetical protein
VRPRRELVGAAFAALVCAAPVVARADARADLEKAHNAYIAHKYDDAESRLRALLDPKTSTLKDPDAIADARMYLGAVLLAEKKNEEAATVFDSLVIDRQSYEPDPLRVNLEAIDAFTDAKARNREKVAAMQAEQVRLAQEEKAKLENERQKQATRLAMLEKMASTELVIERHSRWLALVPFGAGQFQNGQTADGWLFLVGEGLLASATAVASGLSVYYEEKGFTASQQKDAGTATAYTHAAHWAGITDEVIAGGLVMAMVGGIIHAQATFVPERVEVRTRALPPLSLTPIIGPAGIGIIGRF